MSTRYILVTIAWVAWCSLHSLLISRTVSARLQSWLGTYQFHYRLLYNVTALLTLLPVMVATGAMRGDVVYSWRGLWIILQLLLLALSLWLFHDGAKHYDTGYMFGMSQIRDRRQHTLLAEGEKFSRQGSLGWTRHPWYLGSLLFIWSALPVYHQSSVIAAGVLSLYLFVGTWLEERKLLAEYGVEYRSYQQQVSMLLPWKWLMKKVKGE